MAKPKPDQWKKKLDAVITAWGDKAPAATFGGFTLAQFKAR